MAAAGENPAMVFDRDNLMEQPEGMIFPGSREEWEASPKFHAAVVDRLNHQEDQEQAFLDHGGDCFAIYQVKSGAEQRDHRFMNMDCLMSRGLTVDRGNYDLVYTGRADTGAGVQRPGKAVTEIQHRSPGGLSPAFHVRQRHRCGQTGWCTFLQDVVTENFPPKQLAKSGVLG